MQHSIQLGAKNNFHEQIVAMNPNTYISTVKTCSHKKLLKFLKVRGYMSLPLKFSMERDLEYVRPGLQDSHLLVPLS